VTAEGFQIDQILAPITAWARSRADILGLALVGSWARGAARLDSDVDLVLLVSKPQAFRRNEDWLAEINWADAHVAHWHDVDYGSVWSRHIELQPHCVIEFTFCHPSWAAANPIDAGTANVLSGGCRVLVDKAKLLARLLTAASP